ncbi:cupin domain-containing protein [Burkholderia sp. 3C]
MKTLEYNPLAETSSGQTDAEKNAIFYVPVNPFVYKQPPVPIHSFEDERLDLLADTGNTRIIALDLSREMGLTYPATTPNMLARYVVLSPDGTISIETNSVVEIYFVMEGSGRSEGESGSIEWKAGDVFVLPGGQSRVHQGSRNGGMLYLVTDEPMLAFCGTLASDRARVAPTHYSAEEIELNLEKAYARDASGVEAAKSVFFTNKQMEDLRTTSPNVTANLNTLAAGDDQRPHRHNAAALTLSIVGDDVYSVVDGQRADWKQYSVMVTPPTSLHSHHNRGQATMRSFVVQDSGLHYYSRTTGFRFDN